MLLQPINVAYNKPLNFGIKNLFSKKKKEDFSQKEVFQPSVETTRRIFEKQMDDQNEYFKAFATREGKLTREEYKDIKYNHRHVISRAYGMCDKTGDLYPCSSPKNIANATRGLIKHYDKIYGKGNYKILSVGTSPSAITEAMQLWSPELEVIFAPISSLENSESKTKMTKQYPNIATLMKYCTQKGIAKDKDKKIIVLDYVQSGRALNTMGRILAERGDIPSENIKLHSIIDDLKNCAKDEENFWVNSDDVQKIDFDMYEATIGRISNVPHFFMDESLVRKNKENTVYGKDKSDREIFKEFDNFSKPEARAWALCVAHEMFRHMIF